MLEIDLVLIKHTYFRKALLILKKKKRLESTLAKAEAQLENVEQMVSTIEFAQIEVEVVKSLQTGNESLKQLQDLMSIDQIEAILEETREGVEKQREIDELLSGTFAQEDEADLLSELESMVEEVARVNLPEVPSDQIGNFSSIDNCFLHYFAGQEETMEEEDEAVTAKKSKSSRQAVLAS